ncbi:MAG TPA: 2-hydroxyacyl-CoA dehydratase family protein [Spirochaetota bacterium]|nr:2-hydroxyacyl-CoA dehydratase [Spirochaetota bacterium]HOD16770.1 2-hydroxyacyl-CoA dehydratase family protein [Spirochaetota bacterium]HPG52392.1 2-hydroxyacyl-CoA dehydratase family protein [Spirochaetota bacterium]HPN13519.1 2-hydroxyacyl-CoA dehydratase family protein [Spirochaetota bacterium]HQL83480.1 2-hydroxyacyl-CoA dehydratase family protein [Spirochaetota bacterium]
MSDQIIFIKYSILIWLRIVRLGLRHGPVNMVREIRRYDWLWYLLKVNGLMRRMVRGRAGLYREAICLVIYTVVCNIGDLLEGVFLHPDRLIMNEDMVPTEIARAMGLNTWTTEVLGILLPMLDPIAMEEYIDASENEGIPPDICSLPKSTMGMALKGKLPDVLAIVASNLPCDGGMASYELIEKKLNAPIYRLDVPFNFYNDRATRYFTEDLKKMIAWLENCTPGRMDWNRFRDICERRNRMAELEMEIWDMIRTRPAPLAAEAVYLPHLWHFNICAGSEGSLKLYERLVGMCRKNLEEKKGAVRNEKYRAVLWNPPFLHFLDIFSWVERTYGVTLIIDSMTYNSLPLIDTSSPDSMLRGMGNIIMQGPMARHTRGPAENYLDDIFRIYRQFDLDMIWVAGHVGCKNTAALNGVLREMCREAGIPLLILDYDLSDPRIVTHEGMITQVEHFMENVMKAERLAP